MSYKPHKKHRLSQIDTNQDSDKDDGKDAKKPDKKGSKKSDKKTDKKPEKKESKKSENKIVDDKEKLKKYDKSINELKPLLNDP